ncbi:MAG TPA: DUF5074 domain-containing protein [Bacteroidetes bacterium]|nr:DUF5074 domain-containing protein [Bacteroidota bacterium]
MNDNFYRVCLLIFLSIILLSCKKDKPVENNTGLTNTELNKGVFICNEGNFMSGNAQLSFYNVSNDSVIQNLYEAANNSKLGDILNSMCFFSSKAYLIINNSQKIIVADSILFNKTAEISGFTSPRFFLSVNNSKAYVTDLFADEVSVVDLGLNVISKTIPLKGWTEALLLTEDKLFVTNRASDKLFIIDAITDMLTDSIQIGYGANSIQKDIDGKVWVLCEGNLTDNIYASLYRIDPVNMQVEQSLQFDQLSDAPSSLKISGSLDTLYFINEHLYQMKITEVSLPSQYFISGNNKTFYGIGVDPKNGDIYISDVIDYVQRGRIYRYSNDGTLKRSFLAGIIPGNIYFN